jgi:hypothetical protein
MSVNRYQVVFDGNLDVVAVKVMGAPENQIRTVEVIATSNADAQKKAKILVGKAGGN